MNRRAFIGTLGGLGTMASAGMAAAAEAQQRIFVLEHYYLKNGTQGGRIHEHFGKGVLPALNRIHTGPKIFLQAQVASHLPQVTVLFGFQSLDELGGLHAKVTQDEEFVESVRKWEDHAEQPYEHFSIALLQATPYCPEVKPEPRPGKPSRIFELRTYHSPTWRQLQALHERFAGPELRIFARVGVHPILYTSTLIGPNMPNLTYLIPFEDLGAREKAWDAFSADPEWVKVRRESIERHGQISSVMEISLYRATDYSPIR